MDTPPSYADMVIQILVLAIAKICRYTYNAGGLMMSNYNRNPDGEGLEVMILGSFNPSIFHPEWFLRQKLVGEEDAMQAKIQVVGQEVTDIELSGVKVLCLLDRLSLGISVVSKATRMQDILLQIFSLLPHVPVTACGINAYAHYHLGDAAYWHKIGHTLAPKTLVWDELLIQPGLLSLTIQSVRTGTYPGQTNVSVEPSYNFPPGLFVRSNFHFNVPAESLHSGGSQLLLGFLKTDWDQACGHARIVANKIFEKIKPDDN